MTDTASARDAKRRAFLKLLTATTAVLAVGGCTKQPVAAADRAPQTALPIITPPPGVNVPPVWQTIPNLTFAQGVAASISIASYVSDPNGNALTITMNSATLPPGVTFNAANKRFDYDGVGAIASTAGIVLTADDGQP